MDDAIYNTQQAAWQIILDLGHDHTQLFLNESGMDRIYITQIIPTEGTIEESSLYRPTITSFRKHDSGVEIHLDAVPISGIAIDTTGKEYSLCDYEPSWFICRYRWAKKYSASLFFRLVK